MLFDVQVDDTVAVSDSVLFFGPLDLSPDAIDVTVSLLLDTSYVRSTPLDILGINDEAKGSLFADRSASDSIATTDSSDAQQDNNVAQDVISVSDTLLVDVSYAFILQDASDSTDEVDADRLVFYDEISVTEQYLVGTDYLRSVVSDSVAVTEQMLPDTFYGRTLSDSVSVADSTQVDTAFPQDFATVTDQLSFSATYERESFENISLTDSAANVTEFDRTITDSVVVADTITVVKEAIRDVTVGDTLSLSDSVLTEYTIGRSLFDFIDVSDFTVRDVPFVRAESDIVILTEVLVVGLLQSRVLSDTLSVTDSVFVEPIVGRSASDTVVVTDSVSRIADYQRNVSDSVSIADVALVGQTLSRELSDTASTTDFAVTETNIFQADISDTIVDLTDSVSRGVEYFRVLAETLSVTDQTTGEKGGVVDRTGADSLTATDLASYIQSHSTTLLDTLAVSDLVSVELQGTADIQLDSAGYKLILGVTPELRYDNIGDLDNYTFTPLGGVPVQAQSVKPIVTERSFGAEGALVYQGDPNFRSNLFRTSGSSSAGDSLVSGHDVYSSEMVSVFDSYSVEVLGANPATRSNAFNGGSVGDYLEIRNGASVGTYRITSFIDPATVILDRELPVVDSANGSLEWSWTTAVHGLEIHTNTKISNQRNYEVHIRGLVEKTGSPFRYDAGFYSYGINGPAVDTVELTEDGVVVVTFDQEMQADREFIHPSEYAVTGPTDVMISKTWSVDAKKVALQTLGMGVGNYVLRVNSSGTPKDIAGNPVDPVFNEAAFVGSVALNTRSIFTDKGPIARAPETLQAGTGAVVNTITEVTLPGASISSGHIGLYVRLGYMGAAPTSASSVVGTDATITDTVSTPEGLKVELLGAVPKTYRSLSGTYKITGVVTGTRVKLQASFSLPVPTSGLLYWELLDPNNGELADDPTDVTVRVNGVQVIPEAVIGLLGQVVLPFVPAETDNVNIDYSCCSEPTVDFRRLNSKEFRLNSWKRDGGGYAPSQHKYRYNNVLVRPSEYVALDMLAKIDQPELRELHYRAYERAYTPVLNDASLLLLNSPTHKIAFPPSQRTLTEEFVTYEAVVLPEADTWLKHGSGAATATSGVLTIIDNQAGPFPTGQPIFWTHAIDLTFPHVFAMSWRFRGTNVPVYNGVFSGITAGYTDQSAAYIVGFLEVSGVKKIGFLKRGHGDDPSGVTSWTGGVDSLGVSTGAPANFNWNILHSYRIFRDRNGTVRLYVDGDIVETLMVTAEDCPFLEELGSPFDEIQGVVFGSVSREAENESEWDFVRYQVIPTNALQSSPSSFVNYDASVIPEEAPKPWIPIGFHGTETILTNSSLLLDATSATDSTTASEVGVVGGDYKGYLRIEPLLTVASEFVVDVETQLRTYTHGPDPYGLMYAVDDGSYLMQVAFFPDFETPKFSYGGRSFPEDFTPYTWTSLGGATAEMVGRHLRISDTAVGDGKVYYIEDLSPPSSETRVLASTTDYILEFRAKVNTYTVDGSGFAGVFAQTFDSSRAVGLMFQMISGTHYIAFHSDGTALGPSARFAFNWNDSSFHTYRFVKNTSGDLVTLFIDGLFVGSATYSLFSTSTGDAQVSFGSSTPASSGALSEVDWVYCNSWRFRSDQKRFAGIWKGYDGDSLLGYHLPVKASGRGAQVSGNALGDGTADFTAMGVAIGDYLLVDDGNNRGIYKVAGISSSTSLTISVTWPFQPSVVDYRILKEVDWSSSHKYRLAKDSSGNLSLYQDLVQLMRVDYSSTTLPASGSGLVKRITNGLAAVAFGSFSSENLEQSSWDSVQYGITRSPTESRIVPHHQVINQWNVMESPERLFSAIPHELTSFKSSSTGIAPKKDPDFLTNSGLPAFTQLNDGTPLVPSTQTYQVRTPQGSLQFLSVLNSPEDVLNNDGDFVLNDASTQFKLIVPKDILYSSLDVIEQSTGEPDIIAPFGDECQPTFSGLQYTKESCLTYDGSVLPQNDNSAPTPWTLESAVPGQVTTTLSNGVLIYGSTASATVYKNNTTLPEAPGLKTDVKFRVKIADDQSFGTGDTQVRLGLSAPGLTVGLAFITSPLAERYILVVDLNNGHTLGSISFDYLDGNFHEYVITRDPGAGLIKVAVDPDLGQLTRTSVSDTVTIVDEDPFVEVIPSGIVIASNDTISVSDSILITMDYGPVIFDSISITDEVIRATNTNFNLPTIPDDLTVTDSIITAIENGLTLTDSVVTTDSVARSLEYNRAIADTLAATTDSIAVARELSRQASDTIALSDTVIVVLDANGTFNDSVDVTDSVGLAASYHKTVSDTVSVDTDEVIAELFFEAGFGEMGFGFDGWGS